MRRPRRFDDQLMSPPEMGGDVEAALLARLRAWCEGCAFPVLTERLRVERIARDAGLNDVACELDGSHALARMPRWRGLAWRLQLLARECLIGGRASAGDPWDCGWWRDGALTPAESFRPRRPTLLLVRERDPRITAALLDKLQAGSVDYDEPLRVLVVQANPTPSRAH